MSDYCFEFVCFVPPDANTPKLFGFSESLAGLALMVLAWTIADVRYRFRVRTTPLPLQGLTFAVVVTVGILTLLTDLWRAERWLVPQGNLLTPSSWQSILAGLFLLTYLTWAWFAFIRPPVYGKRNAKRYATTLFKYILKGSPSELSVIADELARSAKSLIYYAPNKAELHYWSSTEEESEESLSSPAKVTTYANDILLMIADKRFCRAIVESSPGTAWAIFREIGDTKKYGIQAEIFSKNIVNEALANKDSFLFHEAEGYESGLIGYQKPLSHAMFSNYKMVESIGTLLDPDLEAKRKWSAEQWKVYCRVVLLTFRDYVEKEFLTHSYVLYRAKGSIEGAVFDIYKINGVPINAWDDDLLDKLTVAVNFVKDAVKILDKKGVSKSIRLRVREKNPQEDFYDHLASMIFEIIFSVSAVRSPVDLCWWIQHNSVWSELFNFGSLDGAAGKVVKFKVRRLIYNEVAHMKDFPNFKGAKILGFCLNVMGLAVRDQDYDHDSKALQKAILWWTKKNFAWLHSYNPRVAAACLVDGITYEADQLRLVKTYPAEGLRRDPESFYFTVNPSQPDTVDPMNGG